MSPIIHTIDILRNKQLIGPACLPLLTVIVMLLTATRLTWCCMQGQCTDLPTDSAPLLYAVAGLYSSILFSFFLLLEYFTYISTTFPLKTNFWKHLGTATLMASPGVTNAPGPSPQSSAWRSPTWSLMTATWSYQDLGKV